MRYDDTPFSHTQAEYAKAIEFHILQYLIWDSQFAYDLVVFRSLESVFDKSRVTNVRSRSRYGTLFTWFDKYRVFFHTYNCKSVSSLYSYLARTINDKLPQLICVLV